MSGFPATAEEGEGTGGQNMMGSVVLELLSDQQAADGRFCSSHCKLPSSEACSSFVVRNTTTSFAPMIKYGVQMDLQMFVSSTDADEILKWRRCSIAQQIPNRVILS